MSIKITEYRAKKNVKMLRYGAGILQLFKTHHLCNDNKCPCLHLIRENFFGDQILQSGDFVTFLSETIGRAFFEVNFFKAVILISFGVLE